MNSISDRDAVAIIFTRGVFRSRRIRTLRPRRGTAVYYASIRTAERGRIVADNN